MFKSLRLKNFKAYKDSGEVPLAPLTIIVGKNNSGKSTLFHGLLALAQTAQDSEQGWAPHLLTKGLVDLGGYHDILHRARHANSPAFEISVSLASTYLRPKTLTDGSIKNGVKFDVPDRAEISFSLDEEIGEILVNRSTLRRGSSTVISVDRGHGHWSWLTPPSGVPKNAEIDFRNVFPFVSVMKEDRPSQESLVAQGISSYCAALWAEIFRKQVHHIGPLRMHVPWQASIGERASLEFGSGGPNLLADLGSKEKDRSGKTRLERVNEWFVKKEILSRIHLVELGRGTGVRMLLGDEWHGPTNINIAAMGEGVSQILPIVSKTLFGANDDCILVEQPESHLHPALQAELGDLFIDVTQAGNRQVLVETHSEHLLLRVRRHIAEGTLKPDRVAILFVEKDGDESKVRRLDVNNRGHFSDWPKGFFDEGYQEAMALATAASNKG
jgi:energy-coupling factor transporter ATP-binding protein EcfA2